MVAEAIADAARTNALCDGYLTVLDVMSYAPSQPPTGTGHLREPSSTATPAEAVQPTAGYEQVR